MRISSCQGVRMHIPSNQFFSVLLDTFRICPQESRPSQMVGKRMSNCVAVKPKIAISATWLIRSWCSWKPLAGCCSVLAVLASKSSNLITVVTVGCHMLDHICQIQSCPETIKELWEKHVFKVAYFDSCRSRHSVACIAHTQLLPASGQL